MKILQGTLQPSGYRLSRLVDPEDLDLLRFEDTGEIPEGLDFAIWWKGVWHEGRCYGSFAGRTFVTFGDAQHLQLHAGMRTRRSNYLLKTEHLLELASSYARERGYTCPQPGEFVDATTTIEVGEYIEVAIATEDGQPPLVITMNLFSNGDIRLLASDESFLATPPFDPEDLPD